MVFVLTLITLKTKQVSCCMCLILFLLRVFFFKRKEISVITIFLLGCGVGYFYYYELGIENKPDQKLTLRTLKIYPDTIKIDGDLLTFRAKDTGNNTSNLIRYRLKTKKEKSMVEKNWKTLLIKADVDVQKSDSIRNLNGFDYAGYLELMNVTNQMKINQLVEINIEDVPWYQLTWKLKEIRRRAIVHNQQYFLKMTQNYINSLIFGYRENTPDNYQNAWRNLGVAHLFSLSGMHIYIFLTLFDLILLSLSICREKVFQLNLIFTLFLVFVTGLGPGMIRAGLQHTIKGLNKRFEWHLSLLDCWSLALFINVLFNPYVLLTVGGQLTYYLTFVIIFILPIIKKIKSTIWQGIVFNLILSTLSLPLIWYYFYEWNFLSFLINLLLGPILLLIIIPLLLLTFILSFIFVNSQFLWVETLLCMFQSVGIKLNQINLFKQAIGKFPFLILIVLIISQLFIIVEWERKGQFVTKKIIVLGSLTIFMPFFKYINPYGTLAFVDIGQGDSIFLQLPFHQGNYLLDTGGSLGFEGEEWRKRSDKRGADYTLIPYLKSMGVKDLDTVFISHAHEDHFGDLDRIGESITIKSICYGAGSFEQPNFKKYLNYSQFNKTHKQIIAKQDSWQKKGIKLDILFPIGIGDGQNNDSLVMMLTLKDKKILFTGDLEKEGENKLLGQEEESLAADIIKVGHHGSSTSSQFSFLEKVSPEVAIISCGQNNRYNHPSKDTIENFKKMSTTVYRTDLNGMIYFRWTPFFKKISDPVTIK